MPNTDSTLLIDRTTPQMWGEVADLGNAIIWKFLNGETTSPFAGSDTNAIPGMLLFGWGVVQAAGTTTHTATVAYPSATTNTFEGILLSTDTFEVRRGYSVDGANRAGYPPQATQSPGVTGASSTTVSVIRKADRIAVPIETAVNRGDAVHMRAVLGTGVSRGAFRNAAAAGETIAIPRARFLSTVAAPSAGQLGIGLIVLEGVL